MKYLIVTVLNLWIKSDNLKDFVRREELGCSHGLCCPQWPSSDCDIRKEEVKIQNFLRGL